MDITLSILWTVGTLVLGMILGNMMALATLESGGWVCGSRGHQGGKNL